MCCVAAGYQTLCSGALVPHRPNWFLRKIDTTMSILCNILLKGLYMHNCNYISAINCIRSSGYNLLYLSRLYTVFCYYYYQSHYLAYSRNISVHALYCCNHNYSTIAIYSPSLSSSISTTAYGFTTPTIGLILCDRSGISSHSPVLTFTWSSVATEEICLNSFLLGLVGPASFFKKLLAVIDSPVPECSILGL